VPAEAPLASEVVDFVGAKIRKTILRIAQSQDDTSAVLLPRREIDASMFIRTAAVRPIADIIRFRHCVVSVDGWVVKLIELTIAPSARSIVPNNVNDGEGVSRSTMGGIHVSA